MSTLPVLIDGHAVVATTTAQGVRQVRIANGSLVDLALTLAGDSGRVTLDVRRTITDGQQQLDMRDDAASGEYRITSFGVLPRQEFALLERVHRSHPPTTEGNTQ